MILPSIFFQNLNMKDFISTEHWYSHSTTLVVALLVISAVTCYVYLYFLKPKAQTVPPGPPGLPFFGNLLSLDPNLYTYLAKLAQIYGPIFKLQLGSKQGIVVSSASMAREVLKDNDTFFADRDVGIAGRLFSYGGSDLVWSAYGAEWRMLRKVCVMKMLSTSTLDSVYHLRRKEVRKMGSYLNSQVGRPVNVGEQVFLTVLNVITNMIWGGAVEGAERERLGAEFRDLAAEAALLLGKPNVSDFFPCLARFDLQGVEKRMRALVQRFDEIFEKTIEQRMKTEREEGKRIEKKDFVQFLLNLKEEGGETPLTMTHVKALLMDMVVGGTDTTGNTIEFAMAEMIQKPEVMKRVQDELEVVVGKDGVVEESHIYKLPYLQAVMKESLRLHPPISLLIPHRSNKATIVGGYTIPKGYFLFVNLWAIHRDPSIWEEPLEFDPTRFLDARWNFNGNDFNYIPFGSGRRSCAGIAMAERTVLYFLATLVHSFDWTIPQGEKLDLSDAGVILRKKTPLVAIPTPRLSNPTLYEYN